MARLLLLLAPCLVTVHGQQPGNSDTESGPSMTIRECTKAGGCTAKQARVTMDANWRWIHETGGYVNCFKGATWNKQLCPDSETCAQNCALEGMSESQYRSTYGVSSIPGGVRLNFLTSHNYGKNIGSRLYLMDGDSYQMFRLKNREFAIDVDSSQLECGMNGAVYFVEMDSKGGKGRGQNTAGAKFGTGYCDAQCPHDMKFIDGKANVKDWKPNPKDPDGNLGLGHYGSCCAELDIWEANKMATAFTPHPCALDGQLRCEGKSCGDNEKDQRYDGVCDKDGCDINTFRMGNSTFYGPGPSFAVDSSRPVTVVTQFITDDGTDQGDLVEIRRHYVQDGKMIHSPPSTVLGPNGSSSITDDFCGKTKSLFGDIDDFKGKGGMAEMGKSLDRGHVLALSLWDDIEANMLWLDASYPSTKPRDQPGVARGPCPGGRSSLPRYLRDTFPNAYVSYANVAIGEIGSTTADRGGMFYP